MHRKSTARPEADLVVAASQFIAVLRHAPRVIILSATALLCAGLGAALASGYSSADHRFDLDRMAPLGTGEENAALWFADFAFDGGARVEEFATANRQVEGKFPPDAPLLLEAERCVDQKQMRFYPDVFTPSGLNTRLPNLLIFSVFSNAWIARGDANQNVEQALEDYRRVVRLGRLLRQDDFMSVQQFMGVNLIQKGLEAMLHRYQAAGDQNGVDLVMLALMAVREERSAILSELELISVRDHVKKGRLSTYIDLPEGKIDELERGALESPARFVRREAINSLCTVQALGSDKEQDRVGEILGRATSSDPELALDASCVGWALD